MLTMLREAAEVEMEAEAPEEETHAQPEAIAQQAQPPVFAVPPPAAVAGGQQHEEPPAEAAPTLDAAVDELFSTVVGPAPGPIPLDDKEDQEPPAEAAPIVEPAPQEQSLFLMRPQECSAYLQQECLARAPLDGFEDLDMDGIAEPPLQVPVVFLIEHRRAERRRLRRLARRAAEEEMSFCPIPSTGRQDNFFLVADDNPHNYPVVDLSSWEEYSRP